MNVSVFIYLVYDGDVKAEMVPGCQPGSFFFPGRFHAQLCTELHSVIIL